jgi:hypothetical protein
LLGALGQLHPSVKLAGDVHGGPEIFGQERFEKMGQPARSATPFLSQEVDEKGRVQLKSQFGRPGRTLGPSGSLRFDGIQSLRGEGDAFDH